jgi:hypothetical protein
MIKNNKLKTKKRTNTLKTKKRTNTLKTKKRTNTLKNKQCKARLSKYMKMKGGENNVIKISNNDIYYVNTINGEDIYRINVNGCYKYITLDNDYTYIVAKYKDIYYIYTKPKPNIPNNFEIDNNLIEYIKNTKSKNIKRKDILNYNSYFTVIEDSYCVNNDEQIANARNTLINLNKLLQQKCPNLQLQLEYLHNFQPPYKRIATYSNNPNYLILALCNENKCISSIEILLNDIDNIEINLRTDSAYEGKKYSKLLCSVIIIIANLLKKNIKNIEAFAINPKSAWLLIHYFHSTIPIDDNLSFYNYLDDNNTDINKITINTIKDYERYTDDNKLYLSIPINDININNAKYQYNEIMKEISCE